MGDCITNDKENDHTVQHEIKNKPTQNINLVSANNKLTKSLKL